MVGGKYYTVCVMGKAGVTLISPLIVTNHARKSKAEDGACF